MSWSRARFASLDFEATGLDFARDTIVSFGVVPVNSGTIDVGGSDYELVDPEAVYPSPEAIAIHMLRPVDLVGALSLDRARERLWESLDRRYLVTWFAIVEAAFLDKMYGGGARRWLKRSVDVRQLVFALDRVEGRSITRTTLVEAAHRFGVPVASPHHALDDALVTAQLFQILATKLADHGFTKVKHLLAETRRPRPALVPRRVAS
jgi:DNA polymerase III subunit epsilon